MADPGQNALPGVPLVRVQWAGSHVLKHDADHSPWCCQALDPDTAVSLLAAIRERRGHVDEAVALLHTRNGTSLNGCDQLADLLARHGRIEEPRAYATADGLGHAARRLAALLEERGDVEGVIAVYRQTDESAAHRTNTAVLLAHLLARHGRGDEAIDVMRAQADSRSGNDWILHTLSTLCTDQNHPEDGLAHLDALAARRTPHAARRTPHAARRTPHAARRTPHAARHTPHAAAARRTPSSFSNGPAPGRPPSHRSAHGTTSPRSEVCPAPGGAPICFVKPGEDGRDGASGSVGADRGAPWGRGPGAGGRGLGRGRPERAVG
ncbi:hypothetical protein [Streptomyces sp. NPDC086777]|uniref:tetratricopeptide repeat protein n=1 Tax=Streptomyces sp. NPDC086777 TaxID=3154866 RepID=UPI00344B8D43